MVAVASYGNGQVYLYRINPDDTLSYLTNIAFASPNAVKLLGDRLYVSTELGAFHIYDVSDINNPVSLGSITGTGNGGKWFDIVGSHIYLAKDWSSDEFEIYDVSNPANIRNIGGYATGTMDFRNIKVSGKYAYSASYSNSAWHKGLMRFDISDPKNVTYVTNYQDDYVVGFDIVGDVAYTINTAGTLRALDISSTTMSLIGSASKTASGYSTKLIARGNMIYVLGDNNYLQFINTWVVPIAKRFTRPPMPRIGLRPRLWISVGID